MVDKNELMAWIQRENVNPAFLGRSKRMFNDCRRLKEKNRQECGPLEKRAPNLKYQRTNDV